MLSTFNSAQLDSPSDRENINQLQFTVEVVSVDFPDAVGLGQAFEKIRNLPNYLKPIVLEVLARRIGVSKKTIEKSFHIWSVEHIKKITAATQDNQQNREGR